LYKIVQRDVVNSRHIYTMHCITRDFLTYLKNPFPHFSRQAFPFPLPLLRHDPLPLPLLSQHPFPVFPLPLLLQITKSIVALNL
jgi:hypothetical protein